MLERIKEYAIIVLVMFVGFMAFQMWHQNKQNAALGSKYEQLKENIARANTKVVSKVDTSKINAELRSTIKPGSTVEQAGSVQSVQKHVAQSGTQNSKNFKQFHSVEKELYWHNDSGQKLPIGVAIYEKNYDRWLASTYQLKFDTNIVETKNWDGTYTTTVETHANVPHRKGYEHENYKLHIDNANFEIRNPDALVWSWWNPTLEAGFASAFNPITRTFGFDPAIKFNFINYGYEKQLPVYSFLSPVLLFTNSGHGVDLGLEAASINIGNFVPVIKNLHLGIGYTVRGTIFLELQAAL